MLNSQPTLKTLLEHRSIRKYTGEPIDDKVLTAILEAGRAVSTSSFLQAASIIRVVDKNKRTQLRQISCDMSEEGYQKALADRNLVWLFPERFCQHLTNTNADIVNHWNEPGDPNGRVRRRT